MSEYKQEVKNSSGHCVGKMFTWKVIETKQNYMVLHSVLDKKTRIAILPQPMSTAFSLSMHYDEPNFTFRALCL